LVNENGLLAPNMEIGNADRDINFSINFKAKALQLEKQSFQSRVFFTKSSI